MPDEPTVPEIPPSLEFFIARWEARAAECYQVAKELDMLATMQTAKAAAFRECAAELRRHVAGEPVVALPRRIHVRSGLLTREIPPPIPMPNQPKGA